MRLDDTVTSTALALHSPAAQPVQLETADQSGTLRTGLHMSLCSLQNRLQCCKHPGGLPPLSPHLNRISPGRFAQHPGNIFPGQHSTWAEHLLHLLPRICAFTTSVLCITSNRLPNINVTSGGHPTRRKCFSLSRAQSPLLLKQRRRHRGLVIWSIDIVPDSKCTRAGQSRLVHVYFEQHDGLPG